MLENTDKLVNEKLEKAIDDASLEARKHFNYLEKIHKEIYKVVQNYAQNENFDNLYSEVSKLDKELSLQIRELIQERNEIIENMEYTRDQIFDEKVNNIDRFTIMLFGRTMAGKSTTIQAFLGENLNIHGDGTPDWTKEIDDHKWNGITLVDTPGIEGFDESNFEIAENFMEQADMILMVVSDDHIEPNLMEKLANLLRENKPCAIILNIKAGNPNIAFKRPERVIRDDEVEGHKQRIREYLTKEFETIQSSQLVSEIPIFPVYMEGAFRAKIALKNNNLTLVEMESYKKVYDYSRFEIVIDYIITRVLTEVKLIKIRSAYDSFVLRLEEIEEVIKMKILPLKAQSDLLKRKRPTISKDIRNLNKQLILDFEEIKEIFDTKVYGIDALVEKFLSEGKGSIQKVYEDYLGWRSIESKVLQYREESLKKINHYLSVFESDMGFDLNIVSEQVSRKVGYEATFDVGKLNIAKIKKTTGKVIKVVGRTAAGAAPTALLGWGVANFWNPTGWGALAAGAGVLIVGGVVGYVGSEGAKKLGDEIEKSGEHDIQQQKRIVTATLKKDLQENLNKLKKSNEDWIGKIIASLNQTILTGIDISVKETEVYVKETTTFLRLLSNIKIEILKKEVAYILGTLFGDNVSSFNIYRVVRKTGAYIKIALLPTVNNNMGISLQSFLRDKHLINELKRNFGNDILNIIALKPNSSWAEEQVIESLGVNSLIPERITIEEIEGENIVYIKNCSKEEAANIFGINNMNHFLAELLLNCKILIEEV